MRILDAPRGAKQAPRPSQGVQGGTEEAPGMPRVTSYASSGALGHSSYEIENQKI